MYDLSLSTFGFSVHGNWFSCLDDEQFLQFLLKRIENSRIRAAAREVYIARERLELGNILGAGNQML